MLSSHFREDRPILSTSGMADGNVDLAESGRQQHQQQEQQQQLEHGTEVEVLSVSTGFWFLGKVVWPEHPDKVTIEYMMPCGRLCRKHLCCDSGNVRVVPKDRLIMADACDRYKKGAKLEVFSVTAKSWLIGHVVDPTGTGKFTIEFNFADDVVGRKSVSFGSPNARPLLGEVDPAGSFDWLHSVRTAVTGVTDGLVANMYGDAGCCGPERGQRGCVDIPGFKRNQMECTQAVAGGCALATGTAICVASVGLGGQHTLPCAVVAAVAQVADGNCYFPPTELEFQSDGRVGHAYATA